MELTIGTIVKFTENGGTGPVEYRHIVVETWVTEPKLVTEPAPGEYQPDPEDEYQNPPIYWWEKLPNGKYRNISVGVPVGPNEYSTLQGEGFEGDITLTVE